MQLHRHAVLLVLAMLGGLLSAAMLTLLDRFLEFVITGYGRGYLLSNMLLVAVKGLVFLAFYSTLVYCLDASARNDINTALPRFLRAGSIKVFLHE